MDLHTESQRRQESVAPKARIGWHRGQDTVMIRPVRGIGGGVFLLSLINHRPHSG